LPQQPQAEKHVPPAVGRLAVPGSTEPRSLGCPQPGKQEDGDSQAPAAGKASGARGTTPRLSCPQEEGLGAARRQKVLKLGLSPSQQKGRGH